MGESECKDKTENKKFRASLKSSVDVPKQVLIGTILDVNKVETDRMDFESGFGKWSNKNVKRVNISDTTDVIKQKQGGEFVLVPDEGLAGGQGSEISKSYNIANTSTLEIDFSLYVSGY